MTTTERLVSSVDEAPETYRRQVLHGVALGETDFRTDHVSNECVEPRIGQVASNEQQTGDHVRDDRLVDADLAG